MLNTRQSELYSHLRVNQQSLFTWKQDVSRMKVDRARLQMNQNQKANAKVSFQPDSRAKYTASQMSVAHSVIETQHNFFDIERFPDGSFAYRPKDWDLKIRQSQSFYTPMQKVSKTSLANATGLTSQAFDLQSESIKNIVDFTSTKKDKKKAKHPEPKEDEPEEPSFVINGEYEKIEVNFDHMDESIKAKKDQEDSPRSPASKPSPKRTGKVVASAATMVKPSESRKYQMSEQMLADPQLAMFQKIALDLGLDELNATEDEFSLFLDAQETKEKSAVTIEVEPEDLFNGEIVHQMAMPFNFEKLGAIGQRLKTQNSYYVRQIKMQNLLKKRANKVMEEQDNEQMTEAKEAAENIGDSHINYEFYWKAITSPDNGAGIVPSEDSELHKVIEGNFGSFEDFTQKFESVGSGIKGQGWVWLVYSKETKNLQILTTSEHNRPSAEFYIPLLNIDMWEHSYCQESTKDKADFIKNFWFLVNWKEVAQRYETAVQSS